MEYRETSHIDVLVECAIFHTFSWVRFIGSGDDSNALKSLKIGEAVFLSALIPGRSKSNTPNLMAGKSTTISNLRHMGCLTVKVPFWAEALRHAHSRNIKTEICFECKILDWQAAKVNEFMSQVSIVGTDSSRVLVILRYMIPSFLLLKKSWLRKDNNILVYYAVIESYETKLDVLTCSMGDHTYIKSQNPRIRSGNHEFFDIIYEAERRRYNALSNGKEYYIHPLLSAESCSRYYMNWVVIYPIKISHQKWKLRVVATQPPEDFRVDSNLLPDSVCNGELGPRLCNIVFVYQASSDGYGNISIERYVVTVDFINLSSDFLKNSPDPTAL